MKKFYSKNFIFMLAFIFTYSFAIAVNGEDKTSSYTIEQAMSDKAQLTTISFSGLAFMTGTLGADSFMPPGKVADFFGFQYMRDIDANGYGHNTTFLTKVACNVLLILNDTQKAKLISLAKEQEPVYTNFGYSRYPLLKAFRNNMEGNIPKGSTGLSQDNVKAYTAKLYEIDSDLSYRRAEVVGGIIASLTDDQKTYLEKMAFNNSATWPTATEDETIKKDLTNVQFTALMTYASELFSWYKGSVYADAYFCPERHGTYFGGFYMKDYPAMGNAGYFISTSLTGDSGQALLDALIDTQKEKITSIIALQTADLKEIAQIRGEVAASLRKFMQGESVDKASIVTLIKRYGELDGEMSYYYASRFAEVYKTLTSDQKAKLIKIRNQNVYPKTGTGYLYSTPVQLPTVINSDFLFGIGTIDSVTYSIASTTQDNTATTTIQPGNNEIIISPPTMKIPSSGMEKGIIKVQANQSSSWTVNRGETWVEIISSTGKGNGIVEFKVKPNTINSLRTTNITIADKNCILSQDANSKPAASNNTNTNSNTTQPKPPKPNTANTNSNTTQPQPPKPNTAGNTNSNTTAPKPPAKNLK